MWFYKIQRMTVALAKAGVAFEQMNPVTLLMSDIARGTLREDMLGEKILLGIVEIKVPVARAAEIMGLVAEVGRQIDTVVLVGVDARYDEGGEDVAASVLELLIEWPTEEPAPIKYWFSTVAANTAPPTWFA